MPPPMQCSGNKPGCLKKSHIRGEGPKRLCEVCEQFLLAARYRAELLKLLGPTEKPRCPCGITATDIDFEKRGGKDVCIACGQAQGVMTLLAGGG